MYRIYVYAICKNEEKFAERWVRSMQEADGICVLDTGSTDGTAERLRELGAHVTQEAVTPWRFDTARNRSLELVPEDADLCVCTDLDEVFRPGWRTAMEQALAGGAEKLRYRYTWSFRPDGREGVVFWIEKAHARFGVRWAHPVHEVLECTKGACRTVDAEGVQLDHHPDPEKSRGQYLPLLELAVQEAPEDDRNVFYLGREYSFYGRWSDCERTLRQYLRMRSAVWDEERCAAMRILAQACLAQERTAEAERWLLRACAEAPQLREPCRRSGAARCILRSARSRSLRGAGAISTSRRAGAQGPMIWRRWRPTIWACMRLRFPTDARRWRRSRKTGGCEKIWNSTRRRPRRCETEGKRCFLHIFMKMTGNLNISFLDFHFCAHYSKGIKNRKI